MFEKEVLPAKDAFEIVVARYKEDVRWAEKIPNVTIYDKSGDPVTGSIPLPNVGREAHTYLYHLVSRYETLAKKTLFLQGWPFDHEHFGLRYYCENTEDFLTWYNETREMNSDHNWFWPIRPEEKFSVPVVDKVSFFREYISSWIPKTHTYNWGAQFCVTVECVRKRSKDYYRRLLAVMSEKVFHINGNKYEDWKTAVLMETFWPCVFGLQLPNDG
jgi:hypothetical protein